SPDIELRSLESDEYYRAAEAAGDLRTLSIAARNRATIELQRGDRSKFDAALEQARRIGDTSRAAFTRATVLSWDAALALAEGRFGDSKGLGAAARDAAGRARGFGLYYNAVVIAGRLEQGRHAQVIQGLEGAIETLPGFLRAYRAVLASACAESGRLEAAR